MNEHARIEKAFTSATLAAAQILRFAVENPPDIIDGKVTKNAEDQARGVAWLAKALSREVARVALGPTYAEYEAQRAEWLEKFEAKQAEIAASHAGCEQSPCELCKIARAEDEWYASVVDKAAAKVDDSRPPEWERSQRDGTVQSVPWRTEDPEDSDSEQHEKAWTDEARAAALEARRRRQGQWHQTPSAPPSQTPWLPTKPAPPSRTPWRETPTYKAAIEIGFEPGDTDDVFVHRGLGHVVKMADDGFMITSGWDGSTTYKGTTPDDLVEAMELMDQ
jgi:hypothetical protein